MAGGSGATPRRGRGQAGLRHHLRDGSSAVTPSRQKHFAAAASRVEARRTPEATGALRAVAAGGSWSRCLSVSLTTVCLSLFTYISLSIRESLSSFHYFLSSYRTIHARLFACLTVFVNFIMRAVLIIFLPPISLPFKLSRYQATYLLSLFFFSASTPSTTPSSVTCPFVLLHNRLHPISQPRLSSVK